MYLHVHYITVQRAAACAELCWRGICFSIFNSFFFAFTRTRPGRVCHSVACGKQRTCPPGLARPSTPPVFYDTPSTDPALSSHTPPPQGRRKCEKFCIAQQKRWEKEMEGDSFFRGERNEREKKTRRQNQPERTCGFLILSTGPQSTEKKSDNGGADRLIRRRRCLVSLVSLVSRFSVFLSGWPGPSSSPKPHFPFHEKKKKG